jgi:hypothetical protein
MSVEDRWWWYLVVWFVVILVSGKKDGVHVGKARTVSSFPQENEMLGAAMRSTLT